MNNVNLIGRLTKDPFISQKEKQLFTKINLAVNETYKDKDGSEKTKTAFIDCIAFGKNAKKIGDFLNQGDRVIVSGKLINNNYTDKKDQKVYSINVLIQTIDFLAKAKNHDGENETQSNESQTEAIDDSDFEDYEDDEEDLLETNDDIN